MSQTYEHFIAGADVSASNGATMTLPDPATGRTLAFAAAGTAEDAQNAIAAAHAQLKGGAWSQMSGAERGLLIHRLADLVARDAGELADMDAHAIGRPPAEPARKRAGKPVANRRRPSRSPTETQAASAAPTRPAGPANEPGKAGGQAGRGRRPAAGHDGGAPNRPTARPPPRQAARPTDSHQAPAGDRGKTTRAEAAAPNRKGSGARRGGDEEEEVALDERLSEQAVKKTSGDERWQGHARRSRSAVTAELVLAALGATS